MTKRELEILGILTGSGRVEVAKLAETLGVTPVTVRKDLDALEGRGLIQRQHGYAILGSPDDLNNRLAINYPVKQRIAAEAAQLVQNGETVAIESGSSCALLAGQLAATRQNVTIITNSAFIAGYVKGRPGARVILLGGEYQPESQVMVGSLVGRCMEGFFVDKLFVGTDGFSEKAGFTGNDLARAEAVRMMAAQAGQVVVLTDASKFGRQGVVTLLPTRQVGAVITDSGIPAGALRHLAAQGVQVTRVPEAEDGHGDG